MDTLKYLYNNPSSPACFSGVEQLYIEAKKLNSSITRSQVQDFLTQNRTYTLHKPRRIHFKREKTIPAGYLTDLQVDLADFQTLAKHNNGFRYLLVGVDVLSRRLFVAPTKSKSFKDMKTAFEILFEQMDMLPHRIFSDRGLEFESKEIKAYFKEKGPLKFSAKASHIKAGVAERAIRTIKTRLYRYFSEKNTLEWLSVVNKIAKSINQSKCRVTGLKPVDINFSNAQAVWEKVYGNLFDMNKNLSNLKENDTVRISREKQTFEKGYLPTYSDEIFTILTVIHGTPNTFVLKDHKGEKIQGKFYAEELCKTTVNTDTTWRIEKVLKSRRRKGVKELLVKFIGYPDPEWIKESNVVN